MAGAAPSRARQPDIIGNPAIPTQTQSCVPWYGLVPAAVAVGLDAILVTALGETASKKIVLGVACVAVALAGTCVYLLFGTVGSKTGEPVRQAQGAGDLAQLMEEAAIRIAADSRGELPEPAIEAATGLIPRRIPPVPAGEPAAPPGYEFVRHHGEMPKVRFADGEPKRSRPHDHLAWLTRPDAVDDLMHQAESSGRDWSFGWIRLAGDATPGELERALGGSGAEVVGASGNLFRAKLPGSRGKLEVIASLAAVDAMAGTPTEAKLAAFGEEFPVASPDGRFPVFVTLMSDDPTGEWRRAMEAFGAVVGRFDPTTRVYTATATPSTVRRLAERDFVQAVEPIPYVKVAHDTAVPAMGADGLRTSMGSDGLFSGVNGSPIPIGVADSGLNISHMDIATNRDSICGVNFSWNSPLSGPHREQGDLWYDDFGHGTHVTGTIAGNGFSDPGFAGMAPGIRHIRFAKVLDVLGGAWGDEIVRGMDYLATSSSCTDGGYEATSVKPEIVNMSLGAASKQFEGRSASERKLDSIVWNHRQLYVVAHGNAGHLGFSDFGAAKNSLAVGAVFDVGDVVAFSSHGPTADGRLAPNLVGTGVGVVSTGAQGRRSGYARLSGTSMASPSVAGIAALLLHAAPAHRNQPALTRARLMASAIRPDAWLEDASVFPTHNTNGPGTVQALYGMGKASARPAVLDRNDADGWTSGSATADISAGEYAFKDITVAADADRLDLVLTWDEAPADAITSTVLNDLDLWLDAGADCGTGPCGEYSSRSAGDNVEWIIVRNPPAGTHRAKIVAERIYATSPRPALAWTVIRGPSRPTLRMTADKTALHGAAIHELTLDLSVDGYLASGVQLHIDCRDTTGPPGCAGVAIDGIVLERRDGASVELTEERGWLDKFGVLTLVGETTPLGEVAVQEPVRIKLLVWTNTRSADIYFTASSWNSDSATVSVGVNADDGRAIEAADRPTNDNFTDASMLEGETGSTGFDLLLATPEPGETLHPGYERRPLGSVWYTLHATSTTPIDIGVSTKDVFVEVFEGDYVAVLAPVASGDGGATLFPEADTTYRIRASHTSRGVAARLSWSNDVRPANDDFADAVVLEGSEGSFEGSNRGATLETDEWFGTFAATTWHRWTAPHAGSWRFDVPDDMVVFVLVGDAAATARLVSNYPLQEATLQAEGGTKYHIAVAIRSAYSSGVDYDLAWEESTVPATNDFRRWADDLGQSASSERGISIHADTTVEPGEPIETGTRTAWWVWQAPGDGSYTWHLSGGGRAQKLRSTAFVETSNGDIELLDQSASNLVPLSLRFDATAGEKYWLCVGYAPNDIAAYGEPYASATLSWGPSPVNDGMVDAVALIGARGSVTGTNRFASTDSGEFTRLGGRASLWWTHEVPATGWVRFRVDRSMQELAITVYEVRADGQTVVASSRWQRSDPRQAEVEVYLTLGSRYTISVGAADLRQLGDFTMYWEPVDPPAWLHFDRHHAAGVPDSQGNPIALGSLGGLAFRDDGAMLYAASDSHLFILERDLETGALTFEQSLPLSLGDAALAWDSGHNRLIAGTCGEWHAFEPVGDGAMLAEEGEIPVAEDPGNCGDQVFFQPDGSMIYRVGSGKLDLFAVEDSGALRFADSPPTNVAYAVVSTAGTHVYAAEGNKVTTFEVDAENRTLTESWRSDLVYTTVENFAIGGDGGHLFAALDDAHASVMSLADPSRPVHISTLGGPRWENWGYDDVPTDCRTVARGSRGADLFCRDAALTLEYPIGAEYLENPDFVSRRQPDRFNNPLPAYGTPRDAKASPDGRNVYLSTDSHGIVMFSRSRNEDRDDPDLVAPGATAEPAELGTGEAVAIGATVENRGFGASAATTLRFYRSTDPMVSASDHLEGTATVPALEIDETTDPSISTTAPTEPGEYYYRACVDAVDGEFYTSNNCSGVAGIEIVTADLWVPALSADATYPNPGATFTLQAYVENIGKATSPATTIRYYRSSDDEVTSDDTEIATRSVPALGWFDGSESTVEETAPEEPGTYYYGACVDTVADEADVGNNCYEEALRIVVD